MDDPLSAERSLRFVLRSVCTGYRACFAKGAGAWVNTQKEHIFKSS